MEQNAHFNKLLKFWLLNLTTANIMSVWNFYLRINLLVVNGLGPGLDQSLDVQQNVYTVCSFYHNVWNMINFVIYNCFENFCKNQCYIEKDIKLRSKMLSRATLMIF